MHYYTLFATTIFLSSFLLFQVQPLIGKHILPWYGGSSSVWVTALLFFMVALAIGYMYALGLSRFSLKTQLITHGLVSFATIALMYVHTKMWPSGITPVVDDLVLFTSDPTISVFTTLSVAIGLPFVLLSSTSSLLQLWYSYLKETDPSSLYSISNIGSLLGLLSYPFVVEPLMSTVAQGLWWTAGMALYLGLIGGVIWLMYQTVRTTPLAKSSNAQILSASVTKKQFLTWMIIASVPVMVLLAGTSFMTSAIAPIPLLWVGPLALYLLSFIWSFRAGKKPVVTVVHELAVIGTAFTALMLVVAGVIPVYMLVLTLHAALFAIFHWCHEHLYTTRPHSHALPLFYVALSLGGILGSVIIKVSSVWLLKFPVELMLLLVFSILFILYRWFPKLPDFSPAQLKKHSTLIIIAVESLVIILVCFYAYGQVRSAIDFERNFYGHKVVRQQIVDDATQLRTLQHGLTNHGSQVIRNGVLQIEPVSYYGPTSGIGQVFRHLKETKTEGFSAAVIGLGTGVLAAYCGAEDNFVFIEIDSEILLIAQTHFSYLASCPGATVVVADGRLALTQPQYETSREQFDAIVVDAYADDIVPIHLMTVEAISEYRKRLTEGGFIAIHISSRYLSLLPVVTAIASENNLSVHYLHDEAPEIPFVYASQWVILAEDERVFSHPAFSRATEYGANRPVIWTDSYSALLPIIKLW